MVINRIGDFGLALGIFSVFLVFNSVEYSTVFALAPFFENDVLLFLGIKIYWFTLIGVLLFVGGVGKSAQLGLHT